MSGFPTVDLARPDPAEVDRICRETGFLAVSGHGVPRELLEQTWCTASAFFDLPLASKMQVAMPFPGYPYGYAPFQHEALAKSRGDETPPRLPDWPDLKETFSIGPESSWSGGKLATLWPDEPPELERVLRRYFRAMGSLAARIMSIFATALDLPAEFFDAQIDRHASALRILNYPALSGPPQRGRMRAGAHTDYGSLTILLADAGTMGLEIQRPGGGWQSVPIEPDALIVNVGDLLARWSNDRWVSTLHRVRCDDARRQSIAFFHLPNWDAEIACIPGETPRYEPVIAGEHLMQKFNRTVKRP